MSSRRDIEHNLITGPTSQELAVENQTKLD